MFAREQDERASKAMDRIYAEDSFMQAFGGKPGSDRRKQRRARKGYSH